MEIILDDRIYYNIQEYCDFNQIDVNEYITDCIIKQFNIDRFGDLNEIIKKQKNNEIVKEDNINEIIETKIEIINTNVNDVPNTEVVKEIKKPTKRTLKTK